MNKKNLEKIIADLDDLKNLVEFFSTQEEIPAIEIDIVKRKLQDVYLLFSNQNEIPEVEIDKTKDSLHDNLEERTEIVESKPEAPTTFEIEENEEDKKVEADKSENKNTITEPIDSTKTPEFNTPSSKTTLSDKLRGNNVSLNERLSNKKGSDISSKLKKGPIKDLNEAIGLNDKFSYIKILFGGDANKFREAIEHLNSAQDISQAESYISKNFSWDIDEPVTQQFLDLIHRKLQQ